MYDTKESCEPREADWLIHALIKYRPSFSLEVTKHKLG